MTAALFEPLETVRLNMRCVADCDAAATSDLMTPAVSRWVANWPIPFTADLAVSRIKTLLQCAAKGDALPLAISTKSEGKLIGWVILSRDGEDRGRGSLGYWLGESHQGKGYMKEVLPIVLTAGFKALNLDVIYAAAQLQNAGSFALMEGCGMAPVGERMVFAPARGRDELCRFYEIERARPAG